MKILLKNLSDLKIIGWNPGFGNLTQVHELVSKPDGSGMTVGKITVGNYDPKEETVSFRDESKNSTNTDRMDGVKLDNFIEYVPTQDYHLIKKKKKLTKTIQIELLIILLII